MSSLARCMAFNFIFSSLCFTSRGRNTLKSICHEIDISLFHRFNFSWITLNFLKPLLNG